MIEPRRGFREELVQTRLSGQQEIRRLTLIVHDLCEGRMGKVWRVSM